ADAVDCSIDQSCVSSSPEQRARAFDGGLDYSCVVEFVDKVFVVDQSVDGTECLCDPFGNSRRGIIKDEADQYSANACPARPHADQLRDPPFFCLDCQQE